MLVCTGLMHLRIPVNVTCQQEALPLTLSLAPDYITRVWDTSNP